MSITVRRLLGLAVVLGLALIMTEAMAADCNCRALMTPVPGALDTGIGGGLTTEVSQSSEIAQTQATPRITQSGFCPTHGYVCTSMPTAVVVVRNPNALFDELRQQHRQLAALMQQVLDSSTANRADAYNQFRMALIPHMKAEEATLYKAMQENNRTHMLALKGEEEHHASANVLGELETTSIGTDRWLARFVVLRDSILHHVGEEEGRVFPAARVTFNREQLNMLYTQFNTQQQQIASALEPAITSASYLEPTEATTPSRYDYSSPTYDSTMENTGSPTMSFDEHMGYERWNNFNAPNGTSATNNNQ
ncbi:MAG: hemerythrin domain-containing protein [Armatimonadota bacterium]